MRIQRDKNGGGGGGGDNDACFDSSEVTIESLL